REQGLYRELRRVDSPQSPRLQICGEIFLNFSSNDYLGLANHPLLKEVAIKAVEKFGVGSGASRLICGALAPHFELEEALADFKKMEAALSFSSGYAAAIGTICALLRKKNVIILDKLVHASIVDAARLSGAKIRIFAHNDLNDLEKILRWADKLNPRHGTRNSRALVVTESIFSMDGDFAPLREIVELKNKYGAWLMIDEAHATGLYGKNRRGLAEEFGLSDQVEIQMGTLGKAVGAAGGYIGGSRLLIDFLINRARSFIFSTAPVPAASAAACAGIKLIQSAEGEARQKTLWQRVTDLHSKLKVTNSKRLSAIVPIMIGQETEAVEMALALREKKIFIPAIRYPTVGRGQARLRLTMSAAHSSEDVKKLLAALSDLNLKFKIKNEPAGPT
ncbi:MAG: 8-amino-7-oxononanoate synthase, partial [Verrucomicrobiota bacterium]|nr:8-amino-7-oxononanoate synthase [Verrucomicrobiota bacterium]